MSQKKDINGGFMPKKILVIDDDPIISRYLENIFNDNGYATCSAANGIEAYDVLQKEHPDLITLDLEMPEEAGSRFYRKLTKNKDFKNIPVIVISGVPSRHLAIKNAIESISKPFDPEKLIGIVKNTIG
jgi:DNA-binding NtrC family response regulator